MKKAKKIIVKSLIILVVSLIVISGIAQGLLNLQFRQSDEKILEHFSGATFQPDIKYINGPDRIIRTVNVIHSDTLPLLVFVHGAPGSAMDFINYLTDSTLQHNFNMIGYDRPGYGYSDFGNSMPSIEEQAESLYAILESHLNEKLYMVSHSFGGPIGIRFTMDHPDVVSGQIMLAPALDPEHEKIFAITYLGKYPPTRWLTPTALKVATDEKLKHVEELKKMVDSYDKIESQVIHIHGTADSLVPFENVEFAEKKIGDQYYEKIVIEGEDHFLPWTQFDLIKKEIMSF